MDSPPPKKKWNQNRYFFGWLFTVILGCVGLANLPKRPKPPPAHTTPRERRESF